MQAPAIDVHGLSKAYRVYPRPADRLWEALLRRPRHHSFHALTGLSFRLAPGEALGVVGENGAGKSTLLKILAGVTAPSAGSVVVRGKAAAILELGSGFHPQFTGRQNIVLAAAMLGLSADEVRARMPDIVGFSELGEFIDQPVKCYSTGMAMRLGFSIAMQVDPEVVIIDEALSVGDGYFQKKCMDRLLEFTGAGRTLVFCSHAMYYVSAFCQRTLWLRHGKAEALGPTPEVVRDYENFLLAKSRGGVPHDRDRPAVGPARITAVEQAAERRGGAVYAHGEPWALEVEWKSDDPGLGFHLGVGINRSDGVEVCSFATREDGLPPFCGERLYRARLDLPRLPLVKGEFTLYVFLLDREGLHIYDRRIVQRAFSVESPRYAFGLVRPDHSWIGSGARPLARALATAGDGSRL